MIVQLAPVASVAGQLLLCRWSPLVAMEAMTNAGPWFVRVTGFDWPVVPTAADPRFNCPGARVTAGSVAPDRVTIWGLDGALSVTVITPLLVPTKFEINPTLIVHDSPGLNSEQVLVTEYPPLAVIELTVSRAFPELVRKSSCDALTLPTS